MTHVTLLERFSKTPNVVIAFTDGSCKRNGQVNAVGGIGVYFGPDDARNRCVPVLPTAAQRVTSPRTELLAAIEALRVVFPSSTNEKDLPTLVIATDSAVVSCAIQGYGKRVGRTDWKRSLSNVDLVERLYDGMKGKSVIAVQVPGHSGLLGNEEANRLATWASKEADGQLLEQPDADLSEQQYEALLRTAQENARAGLS